MKKFVLLLLLLLPLPLRAADDTPPAEHLNFGIKDFSSGLYSYADANQIPDNAANYIQNFYTDIQPGLVERNGTTRKENTALGAVNPVTGLWDFIDTSGNEWLIAFSSRTFYKETVGGTFTSFGFLTTTSQPPTATVNLGKIWFSDGTDPLWSFNGTVSSQTAAGPKGTLITSWRNRLVISGVSGNQTLLYFSADGDGTNWTLGGGDADPFTLSIAGSNDGFPIKCIYGTYQDTLIVGRKFDLWGVYGFGQSTEQTRKLSNEVGCIQQNTMRESDGDLLWLSARGIEKMNNSIQLISDPIRNITDVVVKNTANQRQNTQKSAGDWGAGTVDNTMIDTTTIPGIVTLTFPDTFDTYRNGANSTKSVYINWAANAPNDTLSNVSANGTLNIFVSTWGKASGGEYVRTLKPIPMLNTGTTFHFEINNIPKETDAYAAFNFIITSQTYTSGSIFGAPLLNHYIQCQFTSTTTGFGYSLGCLDNTGDILYNGFGAKDIAFPLKIDIVVSSNHFFYYTNGTLLNTNPLTQTSTFNISNPVYTYFNYTPVTTTGTFTLDNFGIAPETGTFTSSLISIGNLISSWNAVSITDSKTGSATATYQFGSTTTASVGSISNYATISNGLTPAVSTGPYAAFKAALSITNPLDTVSLNQFVTSWNEGSSPLNVAWTWDRRYWLSCTTNTLTSPTLDTVLVYQRNKTWTLLKGINASSFARWRDGLYYGDGTGLTGLVYQSDIGNSDDGNAITSILKTKSYDLGVPYRTKDMKKIYTGYLSNTSFSGSFSLAYDLDRSGNVYSLGSANINEYQGMIESKFPFSLNTNPTVGRELQYTLTKSGTGDRLKLYEFRTMYYLKSTSN